MNNNHIIDGLALAAKIGTPGMETHPDFRRVMPTGTIVEVATPVGPRDFTILEHNNNVITGTYAGTTRTRVLFVSEIIAVKS